MTKRRLSQAISEGDGISVIVGVESADAARDAEAAGAEGVLVSGRRRTSQPSAPRRSFRSWSSTTRSGRHRRRPTPASSTSTARTGSGWSRSVADLAEHWELAPRIGKEEHLEFVLEELDPEVLVLHADGDEPLADALELLQDVPAGKLAIADVGASTRDQVAELERAGMDAVIVYAGNIADLVGSAPPEV